MNNGDLAIQESVGLEMRHKKVGFYINTTKVGPHVFSAIENVGYGLYVNQFDVFIKDPSKYSYNDTFNDIPAYITSSKYSCTNTNVFSSN